MAMMEKTDRFIIIVIIKYFYSSFTYYSPCGPKKVSAGPLELDEVFLQILCS